MLRAHVPRNLRVRQSIQIASTRVPARAFLIGAGLIFAGGLMIVVGGADLIKTIWLVCADHHQPDRLRAASVAALDARGGAHPGAPLSAPTPAAL